MNLAGAGYGRDVEPRLPPGERQVRTGTSVDEPISPELVLVDPELARAARLTIPDPGFLAARTERATAREVTLRERVAAAPRPAVVAPVPAPRTVEQPRPEPLRHRVEPRRRPVRRALAVLALYVAMPILLVSAITSAAELASDPSPSLLPPTPTTTATLETEPESAPQETDAPSTDAVEPTPAVPTPSPETLPQPVATEPEPEPEPQPESEQPEQPAQPRSQPGGPRTRTAPAPSPPKAVTPSRPTAQPTILVWLPVKDAAAYRFELFRKEKRVFAAVTKQPRMELPLSWLYESVRYRLERGTYRWVVRPLRNRGSRLVPGDPVVDSVWVVRAPEG